MITRIYKCFSTINAQYVANRTKNAVRFESQNINWDYEELNYQSVALAKGLKSLNYAESTKFITKMTIYSLEFHKVSKANLL